MVKNNDERAAAAAAQHAPAPIPIMLAACAAAAGENFEKMKRQKRAVQKCVIAHLRRGQLLLSYYSNQFTPMYRLQLYLPAISTTQ